MGFLKDLFGAPEPCDLCSLGQAQWARERTGAVDWTVHLGGAAVKLRICPVCSDAVRQAGLMNKSPVAVLGAMAQAGVVDMASPTAYLAHAHWRIAWMHSFAEMGLTVRDAFQAAAAIEGVRRGMSVSETQAPERPPLDVQDIADWLYGYLSGAVKGEDGPGRTLQAWAADFYPEAASSVPFHLWVALLHTVKLVLEPTLGTQDARGVLTTTLRQFVRQFPEERWQPVTDRIVGQLKMYERATRSAPEESLRQIALSASNLMFRSGEGTDITLALLQQWKPEFEVDLVDWLGR